MKKVQAQNLKSGDTIITYTPNGIQWKHPIKTVTVNSKVVVTTTGVKQNHEFEKNQLIEVL